MFLPSGRGGTVDVDATEVLASDFALSFSCCEGVAARDSCSIEADPAGSLSREDGASVEGEGVVRFWLLSSDLCVEGRWVPLLYRRVSPRYCIVVEREYLHLCLGLESRCRWFKLRAEILLRLRRNRFSKCGFASPIGRRR